MLHVLHRKSGGDGDFTRAALEMLLRLGFRTLALSDTGWQAAAAWCQRGLTGYDATHAALAEELEGKWLSADTRAVRRVGSEHAVALDDWRVVSG